MNTVKSLIALGAAAVLLNSFASMAYADEASAQANSKAEVVCETGTYGQNVNCKASTEASATAVLTREGVATHEVVDTGLDFQGIATMAGTLGTGAVALIARRKLGK